MHGGSHRSVSYVSVFIGSVAREHPCCYVTPEALVREVALLEKEMLRDPVLSFSPRRARQLSDKLAMDGRKRGPRDGHICFSACYRFAAFST